MTKIINFNPAGNFPARWFAELFHTKLRRVAAAKAMLMFWADVVFLGLYARQEELAMEATRADLRSHPSLAGNGAPFSGLRTICSNHVSRKARALNRGFFRWTGMRLRARGRFWRSLEVVALDNCSALTNK
jgi:hypothetical protein